MNKDMELIHRLLDREISREEEDDILKRINSDPLLKKEFDDLRQAIHVVETAERLTVHKGFTSAVMKGLPASRILSGRRIRDFFFKVRVVRWNMATALAMVCFVVIVLTGLFQIQRRHNLQPAESTIAVRFNFYAPQAQRVSLAGDFNKWRVDESLMRKQDNGIWTIEMPLKLGNTYNYMFVVDGKVWVTDPDAEAYRDDGFGYKNSILRVNAL